MRTQVRRWVRVTIRGEAPGYVATVAFLLAYVLSVSDAAPALRDLLNLFGAVTGGVYVYRKRAIATLVSNAAWAVITVAGLVTR